ncbi:hypothetical protein [Cytobacillus massiliigabonensis]|uniref:hypothetical protein n=1 Tax=Cytobacillus massiliigabonensis TaxID=1871011 RepID=UPI000C840141|nr:hypothetical protein [Cytobacillus massiliigabonensis]
MSNIVMCPKCNSNQLQFGEKGFSIGKAAVGVITIGSLGALAGLHGKGKIRLCCLNCGHTWIPSITSPTQNRSNLRSTSSTQYRTNSNLKNASLKSGNKHRTYVYGGYSKKYLNGLAKVFWGITLFNLLVTIVLVCTYFLF